MTLSLRSAVDLIANPRNLDASVGEVFQLMVGGACRRCWDFAEPEIESVTAVVGFGGVFTGACVLRCGVRSACRIASGLTGGHFDVVDDTVKDAIGEIANMVAGTWKGRAPELAAHCDLSVPAVITGRDYRLRVQAPEFTLHHIYAFHDVRFEVSILCDGLG
jgi:chemotaxis protein CheX